MPSNTVRSCIPVARKSARYADTNSSTRSAGHAVRAQALADRRADERTQLRLGGHGQAAPAVGDGDGRGDARSGVDQGAVEVEKDEG